MIPSTIREFIEGKSVSAKPHIFIATPCYGGNVHQVYMTSVLGLFWKSREGQYDLTLRLLGGDSLITRARNTLISVFLDEPNTTHIFFIDADIGFDPGQVERMLAFDAEVVAGMYPIKAINWAHLEKIRISGKEPLCTAGLSYVGKPHDDHGRVEQDGFVSGTYAGTGFMLIKREAIVKMVEAYPELRYKGVHGGDWGLARKPTENNYALFDCTIDPETGIYLSEDFTFCRRWTAIGGTIWLDTTAKLKHVGFGVFEGNPAPRFAPAIPVQETVVSG